LGFANLTQGKASFSCSYLLLQAMDLIVESGADLKTLFDQDGLLKKLTKSLVERALNAELRAHLGYDKYERVQSTNARNGTSQKQLFTDSGAIELEIPRDRDGEFKPQLLAKHQTKVDGFNEKVISLYAKGISVSDIKTQLSELYGGAEISSALNQIGRRFNYGCVASASMAQTTYL
jgi:transposase-like protein